MIEVIPAIMPKSYEDFSMKVQRVSSLVSFVQLDLMDGKFVPEKTWPYFSFSDSDYLALLKEEKGLPEWENINYEIDLMSVTPESDVFDWIKIGAKRVILHVESTDELEKLIGEIRNEYGHPSENIVAPEIGLASLNNTALSEWEGLISKVDFVQCMGIARIGYQGEPFDERVIERIETIKKKYPTTPISVDGGVNNVSASRLVKAGATRLVSGSYLFNSPDIREAIEVMKNLA